jgi:hypothetical protein
MPFKPHPTDPYLVIYYPNKYWIPKPWVGLTNEEIDWILDLAYADDMELIKTIEAKLKEKNAL